MPDEILRIQNLTKKKHNYPVLNHFSMDLFAGEILTIVGPDNSAKEMLAQILSGTQKPDFGRLFLMGIESPFYSAKTARENRIFLIDRMPVLINGLNIAENIYISSGSVRGLFWRREQAVAFTRILFEEFSVSLSPEGSVQSLSVFERYILGLLSAFVRGASVIVIDHILRFCSEKEYENLFCLLDSLKYKGTSMILIDSYRPSLIQKSDRILVIRNGKNAGCFYRDESLTEKLVEGLIGEGIYRPEMKPCIHAEQEKRFEADHIITERIQTPLCLSARKGEIIGLTGEEYDKISEIMYTFAGFRRIFSGKFLLDQKPLRSKNVPETVKNGIWLLPHDWETAVLFPNMTVKDNICIMNFSRASTLGFINERLRSYSAKQVMTHAGIPEKYSDTKVKNLPLEYRQNLLMSKILHSRLKVLLLDNPFFYYDADQEKEIGQFLSEASQKGMSVILFSAHIQRLSDFCDRVYFYEEDKGLREIQHTPSARTQTPAF